MDRLTSMEMFIEVAREGSFAAVARARRVSNSVVSKHIAALEQRLGVRLLNRTTRRVSVTEQGRAYEEVASRLLAELRDSEAVLTREASEPRGALRVAAPVSFGTAVLARVLPEFARRYPRIDIELSLDERFVNIVDGGFDVAIRVARPVDSLLVIRKLGVSETVVCASPAYLEARGRPERPEELRAHDCLLYSGLKAKGWPFRRGDEVETIRVTSRFVADSGDVLRQAALAGLGLVHLPTFIVGADLAAGRLQTVLDDYRAPAYPVYALYAHRSLLPSKVRCFLDFLAVELEPLL